MRLSYGTIGAQLIAYDTIKYIYNIILYLYKLLYILRPI